MHEQAIINSILEPVLNPEKVEKIVVELGELAGIEKDHLKEHLLERVNWEIEIIENDSKVKCFCGYQGKANIRERTHDQVIYNCPKCGNLPIVLSGKNIKLVKVIYKD